MVTVDPQSVLAEQEESFTEIDITDNEVSIAKEVEDLWTDAMKVGNPNGFFKKYDPNGDFIWLKEQMSDNDMRCFVKKDVKDLIFFVAHTGGTFAVKSDDFGISEISFGLVDFESLSGINKVFVLNRNEKDLESWTLIKWHNTGTSGLNAPLETAFFEFQRKN